MAPRRRATSRESGIGPRRIATSTSSPTRSTRRLVRSRHRLTPGWRSRKRGSSSDSTLTPKPMPALTRRSPRGSPPRPATWSAALATCAMISAHRSCRSRPGSVSATSRVVRCSSRAPSPVSSRATPRLTLDLGNPSARAAAEKLRSAATLSNTRRSLRSSTLRLSHRGNRASSRDRRRRHRLRGRMPYLRDRQSSVDRRPRTACIQPRTWSRTCGRAERP